MGKFIKLIARNGDAILNERGARIEKSAKRECNKIVVDLDAKVDELTDELELMLDQSPDNRYSLEPGQKFAAHDFANNYQKISVALATKRIELAIAKENIQILFDK